MGCMRERLTTSHYVKLPISYRIFKNFNLLSINTVIGKLQVGVSTPFIEAGRALALQEGSDLLPK